MISKWCQMSYSDSKSFLIRNGKIDEHNKSLKCLTMRMASFMLSTLTTRNNPTASDKGNQRNYHWRTKQLPKCNNLVQTNTAWQRQKIEICEAGKQWRQHEDDATEGLRQLPGNHGSQGEVFTDQGPHRSGGVDILGGMRLRISETSLFLRPSASAMKASE